LTEAILLVSAIMGVVVITVVFTVTGLLLNRRRHRYKTTSLVGKELHQLDMVERSYAIISYRHWNARHIATTITFIATSERDVTIYLYLYNTWWQKFGWWPVIQISAAVLLIHLPIAVSN